MPGGERHVYTNQLQYRFSREERERIDKVLGKDLLLRVVILMVEGRVYRPILRRAFLRVDALRIPSALRARRSGGSS